MKRTKKQTNCKGAFTIIELLTVMSIIVVLIGLLVPSLNATKRFAKQLRQKAQIKGIDGALELFQAEHGGYPDSDAKDDADDDYCGAMKLAEAMVGQDYLGFHPDSKFRSDGTLDGTANTELYPNDPAILSSSHTAEEYALNLKLRSAPYLTPDNSNAYPLSSLYANTGVFASADPCSLVLCDVYSNVSNRGTTGPSKIGMPILYYRADVAKNEHDVTTVATPHDNIYDYEDNDELVALGLPSDQTLNHIINNGGTSAVSDLTPSRAEFYLMTKNPQVTTTDRPYRADSYILISAGFDGVYGTSDDICNFDKQ